MDVRVKTQRQIRNEEIRRRTKVKQIIATVLKWKWASHVERQADRRWTKNLLDWRTWPDKRNPRSPPI